VTISITVLLVGLCFWIKSHYLKVASQLRHIHVDTKQLLKPYSNAPLDPLRKTAVLLVSSYGTLGIQTLKNIVTNFPGVYSNILFASVGVIDSGAFKGEDAIGELAKQTEKFLLRYQELATKMGFASAIEMRIGTEVVETGGNLCEEIAKKFQQSTFFASKVIFEKELWLHRLLHNETAFSLQKRLQLDGLTMVILPVKLT
jgi:hypothetical protein